MRRLSKAWLVAYDISDSRRLGRVHRKLRKEGIPAQYSIFTVEADDDRITELLEELRMLIDEGVDDLRAYHLPASCTVWGLGTQHWVDGVCLSGTRAARLLMDVEPVENDGYASDAQAIERTSA